MNRIRLSRIDTEALDTARAELGTRRVTDTINAALRRVARIRIDRQQTAMAEYSAHQDYLTWRRLRDEDFDPY